MTKLPFSNESNSESVEYSIDDKISAVLAWFRTNTRRSDSVRTRLNALISQRENEANLRFQEAQSYLRFVREDTERIRGILEDHIETPHQAQEASLGRDSSSSGNITLDNTWPAPTRVQVPNDTSQIESEGNLRSLINSSVKITAEEVREREYNQDKRREADEMDSTMEEDDPLACYYEDDIPYQWEDYYIHNNGWQTPLWDDHLHYMNDEYREYEGEFETRRVYQEEDALWEAAEMIAAEERQAQEEQDAIIEEWQRECLEQQKLQLTAPHQYEDQPSEGSVHHHKLESERWRGKSHRSDRYPEPEGNIKVQEIRDEEEALLDAAEMIAAEERRAQEEQDAIIEEWQRECLEEQQDLLTETDVNIYHGSESTWWEPQSESPEGEQRRLVMEEMQAIGDVWRETQKHRYRKERINHKQQERHIPYHAVPSVGSSQDNDHSRHQEIMDHHKRDIVLVNILLLLAVIAPSFACSPSDHNRVSI